MRCQEALGADDTDEGVVGYERDGGRDGDGGESIDDGAARR